MNFCARGGETRGGRRHSSHNCHCRQTLIGFPKRMRNTSCTPTQDSGRRPEKKRHRAQTILSEKRPQGDGWTIAHKPGTHLRSLYFHYFLTQEERQKVQGRRKRCKRVGGEEEAREKRSVCPSRNTNRFFAHCFRRVGLNRSDFCRAACQDAAARIPRHFHC